MNSNLRSSSSDVCEPPFDAWGDMLQTNWAAQPVLADRLGTRRFKSMRSEIIEAARSFTNELNSIATKVGLATPEQLPWLGDDTLRTRPIVASGHQPIIFHPGIVAKNLRLEQLAKDNDALGLLILIDTDEGNATRFQFPTTIEEKERALQTASLGSGGDLYLSQSIGDSKAVSNVAELVQKSLAEFGFAHAADRTATVMDEYVRLSGKPAAVANSIVRRGWENQPDYLEIPFSKIVSLPSIRSFLDSLIEQADLLHETYNSTLSKYRTDHKIRNRANPFPNLASEGESIELPFWVLNPSEGTRTPLIANRNAPSELARDLQIVPRGMMITTLLRLVCSDIFIHGTGGAKYDQCTDLFISSLFQTSAPKFVAATATRHLFEAELKEVARSRELREQVQEIYGRFQRHVESDTFQNADQNAALDLLSQRTDAISRLKSAKTAGQSASEINTELKAINSEILQFVERMVFKGQNLTEPNPKTLKILENRTFPYFFFANS